MSAGLMVRITAPVLLLSLLLLAAGVGAAWYLNQLQRNISRCLAQNVTSMRAAEELEISIREVRHRLSEFLRTGDREHLAAITGLRQDTDRWLGEAERLATTPREQELMALARGNYDRFFEAFDRDVQRAAAGEHLADVSTLIDQSLSQKILPPVHDYLDFNEDQVTRTNEQNQALVDRVGLALVLLGSCGCVAGLVAGFGLARGLSRSIVQLSVPIRTAAGKLSEIVGPVILSAGSDFRELEVTLGKVTDQIGAVVEQLQRSQREALRAEQLAAVGHMAAGLADELRNPLTAIKILVQSAVEQGDPVGLHGRDLAVLEDEVTRLEGSLQTFLDFIRPPQPRKRAFEVGTLIEQVTALVAGRAAQQGVAIECDLPEPPVVIEADRTQVRQVLLNLMLNALEAMSGGGTVWVRVKQPVRPVDQRGTPRRSHRDPGGRDPWLTIHVADSGCGLPADLGGRIFEPFVSSKETGLGLGLSICKRIVEAHGGEITAANRPQGGAVLTVRLPGPAVPESRPLPGGLPEPIAA